MREPRRAEADRAGRQDRAEPVRPAAEARHNLGAALPILANLLLSSSTYQAAAIGPRRGERRPAAQGTPRDTG